MGDPACHLSSACLSCGRYLGGPYLPQCPHCGAAIDNETAGEQPNPVFTAENVNTILYCDAFDATVCFYRSLLGLEVTFSNDWFFEFMLGDQTTLSIADAQRASIPSVDGKGMTLSLEVDDLDEVRSRLTGLGAEATPISKRFGSRVFDVHDPEGHRIEFWARS